jgi:hypothetical protein
MISDKWFGGSIQHGFVIICIPLSGEKVRGLTFLQNKQDKRETAFFCFFLIIIHKIALLYSQFKYYQISQTMVKYISSSNKDIQPECISKSKCDCDILCVLKSVWKKTSSQEKKTKVRLSFLFFSLS